MKRPSIIVGIAALTGLLILASFLIILFSVNPGVDRNEGEIRKAVMSQKAIICAQVQTTANAYRFRSLTPSGDVEPIRHFLTRMQAQQQTLRLARGSECKSAPGFPPVGLQVRRALEQIDRILGIYGELAAQRTSFRQVPHNGHNRQAGFLPRFLKPSETGVDESGVPAKLHDELAPGSPVEPRKPRHPRSPKAPGYEQPPGEPPAIPKDGIEGEDNPPTTQVKGIPVPLPELPVEAEVSTEEELNIKVEIGDSP